MWAIVTGARFPRLGQFLPQSPYRTEPGLRSGAELPQTNTILVGQRSPDPAPKAAILLGHIAEQTASRSFFHWAVWLDASFPHVMLIAGKRGSGKSYDLGIIAEGLCSPDSDIAFGTSSFAMILFDTQNQFWTLTRKCSDLASSDRDALKRWGIGECIIQAPVVYRPRGTPVIGAFETEFALRPSDLEADDWTALCGVERFQPMGQCLRAARSAMRADFDISAMLAWLNTNDAMSRFNEATILGIRWRLESVIGTELFDRNADDITMRLAAPGNKSVLQLADLDDETKAVVVAVILRRLIKWAGPAQRRRKIKSVVPGTEHETDTIAPRIWALIDEAHLVCPASHATAARPVIVDYVKRGRDAGLSLVLATQQPSALDTAAISQCDIVSIHKLTIDHDINAATARMPARPPTRATKIPNTNDISKMEEFARALDAGESLFADSESSRAFVLRSRPRLLPHGGGEPEL